MNVPSNWYRKSFAIWKLILWAPFSATLHYHNGSLPGRRKQRTKNTTKIDPPCPGEPYLTVQFEKIQDWHMKNAINISNNVNLIFNTYRCFFFKLLLRTFDVVWKLRPCYARRFSKTSRGEMAKWLTYAYGMSTNLPRYGPKWKSANYGLEPRNDSVGVIKRSKGGGGGCKEDQYWFRN